MRTGLSEAPSPSGLSPLHSRKGATKVFSRRLLLLLRRRAPTPSPSSPKAAAVEEAAAADRKKEAQERNLTRKLSSRLALGVTFANGTVEKEEEEEEEEGCSRSLAPLPLPLLYGRPPPPLPVLSVCECGLPPPLLSRPSDEKGGASAVRTVLTYFAV